MTTYPIDPAVSGPGSFMVEINPDAGTARLVPMAEVQRLRDADVDQHVILPDVQRENERLREELNTVRSGGAVPRKPPYDRLYINWQRATEDAAMGWAENARNVESNVAWVERWQLARDALVATGYFAADEIGEEIGEDIAPRITEYAAHMQQELAELFDRIEGLQQRFRTIRAALGEPHEHDRDPVFNLCDCEVPATDPNWTPPDA